MSWFRWNDRSVATTHRCRAQWLCAAVICGSLAACGGDTKPLTQIVVGVDSDWDGFDHLQIDIGGFDEAHKIDVDKLTADPLPRHIALVHDGGPLGPLSVTVSAYVKGGTKPALVEPRTGIYFVKDKTRLLMIDLLLDCAGKCDAKQACIAPAQCVESGEAAHLGDWNGALHPIKVAYHVGKGDTLPSDGGVAVHDGSNGGDADSGPGGMSGMQGGAGNTVGGAGSGGGGGNGAGGDGNGGAGSGSGGMPSVPSDGGDSGMTTFAMLTPSNVDLEDSKIADLARNAVVLDCASPSFDSNDMSFSDWCGTEPEAIVVDQDDSHDAALLVMSSLTIASGTTLHLTGDKPIILLVYEAANIAGTIDASAHGTDAGPGADRDCDSGNGEDGSDGTPLRGAAGGGGGGFGSAGGRGASGDGSTDWTTAGEAEGSAELVPLRGGCSGGSSGEAPNKTSVGDGGGGGGAVQISVLGTLDISGKILATGGGGAAGEDGGGGSGGGGSGGAILLEAGAFTIDASAVISANGGGGGAGQPYPLDADSSTGGEDGHAAAVVATGGTAVGIGGNGGAGAWRDADATDGVLPTSGDYMIGSGSTSITVWGGGGGGGGGAGRIRMNHGSACPTGGTFTPAARCAH